MADRESRERLIRALDEADRVEREIIDLDRHKDYQEIRRLSERFHPTSSEAR